MDIRSRNRILTSFRQRLFNALFLKNSVMFASILLLVWGVVVLALRVWGLDDLKLFGFGLLVLLAVPPLAWLETRRRVPDERKLASILDRDNHVGGLLMSSFEVDLGEWSQKIDRLDVPNVRWSPRRTLGFVALAVVFAAASILIPMSAISGTAGNRLNIDDQVKRLTTQLDVMEEENLLDIEEIETQKFELKKIQKEADGMGPVKTFDALDHISDRMNQKAAEAVENAQRDTETLAKTEALMRQVRELSAQLDDSTKKSLMDGLADSLEEMLAENEQLAKDLKDELAKKAEEEKKEKGKKEGEEGGEGENGEEEGEKGEQNAQNQQSQGEKGDAMAESLKKMLEENNMQNMTPEMLEQLSQAMKQCQGNCERMVENLQNAGFPIDKDMLQKLAESQNIEKEEAERMLSDLWANCDGCQGEPGDCDGEQCEGPKVSERYTQKQDWTTDPNTPPGDTRFEKEPDEEGAEFKAQFLPPSKLEAFRNSQKIGASISAPDVPANGNSGDHGGAIGETGGGIGSAHGQKIHPQHLGPVGRYFEK